MRLIAVRFGNVLASNGSVVPKFKAQIEAGGPLTVTHRDMVRYFMTIREACDLVVTAASHALGSGHAGVAVYVLNMGQPVKIIDLAERMIRLSGLEPGRDIDITFTGIRPGERLREALFAHDEPTVPIGIEGIVAAKPVSPPLDAMRGWLARIGAGTGPRGPLRYLRRACATPCPISAAKRRDAMRHLAIYRLPRANVASSQATRAALAASAASDTSILIGRDGRPARARPAQD